MNSACSFIFMQIKVIFKRMVSHLDSLSNRGTRELRNGLWWLMLSSMLSIATLGYRKYAPTNIIAKLNKLHVLLYMQFKMKLQKETHFDGVLYPCIHICHEDIIRQGHNATASHISFRPWHTNVNYILFSQ